MAVNPRELIVAAVAFILLTILTPLAMAIVVGTSTTSWNASVVTMFQVLVPVLFLIGCAIYFIPQI